MSKQSRIFKVASRFGIGILGLLLFSGLLVQQAAYAAPPSYGNVATAVNGTNTNNITIARPAGTAIDDLLLAAIATDEFNANTDVTAPAGWTLLNQGYNDATPDVSLSLFYKVATASEPANYTFNWTVGNEQVAGAILRYSGVDPSNPIHLSAVATGNNNAPTAPNITTTVNETMIVRIFAADDDDNPIGYPAGHNGRVILESGTGDPGPTTLGIADVQQAVAGATGTAAFSLGAVEEWRAVTVALNPIIPNQINGTVFRDYDASGSQDTYEPGVENVIVTAYDASGNTASTITDINGNYTILNTDGAPGNLSGEVRIEFTIPASLDFFEPGAAGGTTVQFVDISAGATANVGLNNPAQYSEPVPEVVVSYFVNGDPLAGGTTGTTQAFMSFPYDASGVDPSQMTTVAIGQEIGALWGTAPHPISQSVFSAAIMKRHTGFGPLGSGGIYRLSLPSTVVPYIDVKTIGIDTGPDVHSNLAANSITPTHDPAAFDAVGKYSFGDMDMAEDESKLWFINLYDRTLYSIDIGDPVTTPTAADVSAFPITDPGCSDGEYRPWAVDTYDGDIYVGIVCSAETSQNINDLHAYIIKTDADSPGTFTPVFDMPLNYPRGYISAEGGNQPSAAWLPWIDQWTDITDPLSPMPAPGTPGTGPYGQTMYPQPMLTDIEFDIDGSMILAFTDRFAQQGGNENYSTNTGDATTYEAATAGDLIRVCNDGGTFVLENNATCPGGSATNTGSSNQGPGGREYYWQDMYGLSADPNGGTHQEITVGSMAHKFGSNELLTAVFDPVSAYRAGGVAWFSQSAGTRPRSYEIFGQDAGGQPTTFGKAAGIGDVELLPDPAPIELGSRVWDDADGNGIQDPGESVLGNVIITLWADTNGDGTVDTQVGTTTSDPTTGEYYFNSSNVNMNGATQIERNTAYEIRIDTMQGVLGGGAPTLLNAPQPANGNASATDNDPFTDVADSDAVPHPTVADTAVITITTGGPGSNNHGLDFGFAPPASIGDYVWNDTNANGIQDGGETGIGGVIVELFNGAGVSQGTTTTAADGSYSFTNLPPGDYYVDFTTPAGYAPSPQDQGADDALDSDADTTTGETAVTTLTPGENDTTWDAGFYQLASIGDYVWVDTNGDGIQDGGESGIGGVTVELFNGAGVSQGTTTTAADGSYSFTDLVPGDYYIEFTTPAGYVISPQDQGGDDALDSDANPANGQTTTTTLSAGENDLTWDAGLMPLASIGDFVWEDLNADGIQDGGETGIGGVTVELFNGADVSQGTTTTAADGSYSFTDLVPGDYYVQFTTPAGYNASPQDQGADDALDSDASVATGQTAVTTLTPGENDTTWDAGFYQLASIGDFVWDDTNGDGIQDGGETGIGGVTVELFDGAGVSQGTTTTAADGSYSFTNLVPGDYYVEFTTPVGYTPSPQDQGGDDALDSDANTTTGRTVTTTLTSGENDITWDAGFTPLASIGDFVWEDLNADGIQDGGESGIAGVTVELFNGAGVSQGTTTTAADGSYSFTDLVPGDYYVEFTTPVGFNPSPQDQGADDALDSDASVATGQTATTTLTPGENDPTWDAGFYQLASIGDYVWEDLNADGIQDGGESGIGGVTVELFNGAGVSQGTTTTAADGSYSFTGLVPGDYYVQFTTLAGFNASPQDQGADDASDSDASIATGQTATTTLTSGEDDTTWDAGFYQLASIGDYVWEDANGDGIQDGGETGIAGVTIELFNDAGVSQGTTTTAADGSYSFTNLVPGDYYVAFTTPAGYTPSPQDQGADDALDSDADVATGETAVITLTSGENDITWDAGYTPLASIGDYVWEDTNADGIQDGSELGIAGVTVELFTGAGVSQGTTTTAADGSYSFTDLIPGDYYVDFTTPAGYTPSPQDQGADDALDSDADVGTGETAVTTLDPGENDPTWDAGFYQSASIGDFVWADTNGDGIQDGGESGIPGVTVELFNGAGVSQGTTITAADGSYSFTNLLPGDYYVEFTTPAGYAPSPQDQGGDDTLDSDADTATGQTVTTTLTSGENDITWDAGFMPLASIGDFVWADTNGNGIQDGGELGIVGVTVELFNGTGVSQGTTTTAADGSYSFTGLVPGDYYVAFTTPAGYTPSPQDQGADDALDSDADLATGETAVTTLTPGENDITWDAGFYQPASIGDFVWEDTNGDGIQDGGELGIAGVMVELFNGAGVSQGTTTTAADGSYSFTNLVPGDYYVEFTTPAGYMPSPQDQGADDALDSDVDTATGQTATTTLDPNENDLTWDAGFVPLASIGDYVWEDLNADGIQDGGEIGIAGVTVELFNGVGVSQGTTTTAADGSYSFTDLVPGDYYVAFTTPAGYTPSPQDQGADDALDSDADVATGETAVTTLDPGENDPTWDAGFYQLASIGDYVWEDTNADGIQDGGESGVAGVTVELFNGAGISQGTTTTAADGSYSFTNLVPGDYYVAFTLPSGYIFSPQDQGGDDALDSDADTTSGETAVTTLIPGENDITWDAGLIPLASIGDYVWEDTNANGIQDGGEIGIGGVTVELFNGAGVSQGTTTTAADGSYSFTDLVPGDYYVAFTTPAGFVPSPQDQGADDALDSDADVATGETAVTTLDPGENDPTWDAGFYQLASIGDYVWNDANADGIQDGGETGIAGVTVELFNGAGVSQGTTTTAADGSYSFTNLVLGDYYVAFTTPVGYAPSPQDQGADDALDSDADVATGQTVTTTLTSGEDDLTWDAGFYQLASIGDYVWEDLNADGIQDGGETGIAGVTVELFNGAGVSQGTTTTAADGSYSFTNLVPGDYYVDFTLPSGYVFSPQDQGGDDILDSDANTTTGETVVTTLVSNEDDPTWDAGLIPLASIGDYVWEDLNADGIQDGGETGIAGVTVELFNGAGVSQGTTTTAADGSYSFTNLVPGDYYVDFTAPAGYAPSPQDQGADDALDSDADVATGETAVTTLDPGENDPTWDAGFYQLASIGDYVWEDLNADGIQDGGESGVAGVTVELFNGAGVSQGTTTTAADGSYSFTNLVPGDYYVEFTLPSGYVFSPQDQGGDDTVDSDADTTTGETAVTTLVSNEDDPTWDAGLIPLASIGDYVWLDANADGIQDGSETGIAGVTVELFNGAGVSQGTTTTAADGSYSFTDLVPGDYYVAFTTPAGYAPSPQDQGGDDALDSDADVTTGETAVTTLDPGENDPTWDAGFFIPASIGDYVWEDTNADGIQDGGELGIAGVTVELFNGAGVSQGTTTTAADGSYSFTDLIPGDYYVAFTTPAGYIPSPQDQGADDALDSDADVATGETAVTTLDPGENDPTWDAGFFIPASIGDYVWEDTNADGIQDGGELGIAGVTVELFNGAGVSQGTTTTAADGSYSFTNLVPGDYYVDFTTPAGYTPSPQDQGADDALDSDADVATGETAVTTLDPGENDPTWDAGFYQLASIGDYVWEDLNADGIQDGGESGVAGVIVELFNGAGVSQGTTTTAADGSYSFTNLVPGDYYVEFTLPSGYVFSPQDQGGDDTVDSDADTTTGETAVTTLVSNEDDPTWDAGLIPLASIGDYVWLDANADGIQDGSETGIAGVTVELFNGAGVSQGTTTTAADGSYSFTDLVPGDYYVAFTTPAGYAPSPQDQGGDDALDSDADVTTGETAVTTLDPGENDPTWDAGFFIPASIGDYVWEDINADGIQDGSESGVAGVTVELFDGAGVSQGTTTTAADGSYSFTNLVPGDYYVQFTLPSGYVFSSQDQGGDDAADSDADTTTGETIPTTLVSGEDDPTWDAGLIPLASIGDTVWEDLNADGIQDVGETGIGGVTVELFNSGGVSQGATTTAADGSYSFTNLVPGDYYVAFTIPAGYAPSPQNQGGDVTVDSDGDVVTGETAVTTLDPGENDPTWDMGVFLMVPDIVLVKDVSIARVVPNQFATVTYTLRVTNTGNIPITTVNITDTLPANMTFVPGTANPAESSVVGQTITWNDITSGVPFAPGASITVTFEADLPTVIGNYVNDAGVVGITPVGSVDDQDDVTVLVEDPSVELNKVAVAPGIVGGFITYTIQITNTGPSVIDVLPMVDNFNGPMDYVGGTPAADSVDNVNQTLVWNDLTATFGNLAPGQSITIETVFRITSIDTEVTLINRAQVVGAEDLHTNPTNEPEDEVQLINVPTAVSLTSFTAVGQKNQKVLVKWTTESEIDNFGFELYRSDEDDFASAASIHFAASAVPGGSGPGTTYSFTDDVPNEGVWYYWLVDIDTNGVRTVHGPVEVNIAGVNHAFTNFIFLPMVVKN